MGKKNSSIKINKSRKMSGALGYVCFYNRVHLFIFRRFFYGLLRGKLKPIYFKYLGAAFGSALITSIYAITDTAMVGQYQGPDGTAALAVVAPIWNILYSMGLLMGIGGSVIFSNIKGKFKENEKQANAYFTTAVIGAIFLAVLSWIFFIFFDRQILLLFGAKENLLPLWQDVYIVPIKFAIPFFLSSHAGSISAK